MTIDELEDIWFDGNRQDPNFINMVYNMLGRVNLYTNEDTQKYRFLCECVQDEMEDWLHEQVL